MFRSPSTIRTLTRSHSSTISSSSSTSTFTLCITCHSSPPHHRSFASTPRVHKKPLSPLINRPPVEIPPREMTNRWSKHTLYVPKIDKTLRTMPINRHASPDRSSDIQLPILALGTRNIQHQAVKDQVSQAMEKGIIHIDTATGFRNFASIATLLRESGRPRDSYFLTLKWSPADIPSNHWTAVQRMKGYIKSSGLQYVDVLMMHWPGHQTALSTSRPANYRHRYVTWRVMEDIYKEGYAKALGVANFEPGHIGEILSYCEVPPAINQIEYHPYLTHIQEHNIKFGRTHGILTTGYASLATGWSSLINEPVIQRICLQHNREFAAQNITTKRTPIQVLLRWSVQHGVPPTFRSSNPDHMSEALDIYTFELTPEEMRSINELSRIRGIGGHGKRFFGDPRLVA